MASSSASAKTYELRIGAARGRVLEAAKFRDLVPALETSTGPVPRLFCQTPLARQCRPKTALRDARGGQAPESQASTPATGGVVRPV